MPTYDYLCKACGKRMEIFHSMTEPARKKCPQCGKSALERQLGTGGAIIFKGSGFYQTDYRSDGYKKAAEAETKPAESKPAESKPAESKPAAKAEPKPESKPAKKPKAGKSAE